MTAHMRNTHTPQTTHPQYTHHSPTTHTHTHFNGEDDGEGYVVVYLKEFG